MITDFKNLEDLIAWLGTLGLGLGAISSFLLGYLFTQVWPDMSSGTRRVVSLLVPALLPAGLFLGGGLVGWWPLDGPGWQACLVLVLGSVTGKQGVYAAAQAGKDTGGAPPAPPAPPDVHRSEAGPPVLEEPEVPDELTLRDIRWRSPQSRL